MLLFSSYLVSKHAISSKFLNWCEKKKEVWLQEKIFARYKLNILAWCLRLLILKMEKINIIQTTPQIIREKAG